MYVNYKNTLFLLLLFKFNNNDYTILSGDILKIY
jgi:hypothetical protein